MNINNKNLILPKSESWKMFDAIAPNYDLLNRLLSFGIDKHWRRCLGKFISLNQHKNVLDLATGTGDVLLILCRRLKAITQALGTDMSGEMLAIGQKKITRAGLESKITLQKGDANQIEAAENSFENVTMAFGIRNVNEPLVVLKEMRRVLAPGGRALVLEFSLPQNRLLKTLHLFYLRRFVPFIGGLVSGNRAAYQYLNQTIENFPYGDDFLNLMSQAGFTTRRAHPLFFGVASIYVGEK